MADRSWQIVNRRGGYLPGRRRPYGKLPSWQTSRPDRASALARRPYNNYLTPVNTFSFSSLRNVLYLDLIYTVEPHQ